LDAGLAKRGPKLAKGVMVLSWPRVLSAGC